MNVPGSQRSPDAFVDEATSEFLKALASRTRQQIMFLFANNPRLSVGEVAELADLSQSTASAHLAELRRGGLLQSTRDGKTVHYRVNAVRIAQQLDLIQAFLACCCTPDEPTADSEQS